MVSKNPSEENPLLGYLIYAGPRDGGKTYCYLRLEDLKINDGNTSAKILKTFNTDSKVFKNGSVGAIYEVKFTSESSIKFDKDALPISYWNNRNDRAQWKTLEEAVKTVRALKKEGSRNYMIEILEPIRKAYKEGSSLERKAIVCEVIRAIVTYID